MLSAYSERMLEARQNARRCRQDMDPDPIAVMRSIDERAADLSSLPDVPSVLRDGVVARNNSNSSNSADTVAAVRKRGMLNKEMERRSYEASLTEARRQVKF